MRFDYRIEGMHCSACIEKIKASLASQNIIVTDISLNPPRLQIEADQSPNIEKMNAQIAHVGSYRFYPISTNNTIQPEKSVSTVQTYYPIILITSYILGVSILNNMHSNGIHWQGLMNQFMAGFFLVFSAFKLLDIRGFAEGYASYDLLARRWHPYGFIYPFLELGLGIAYLTGFQPHIVQIFTIIIMGFSSLGVINSLRKKQEIQCACLGTVLKVPLSNITLTEDLVMVGLATLSLLM